MYGKAVRKISDVKTALSCDIYRAGDDLDVVFEKLRHLAEALEAKVRVGKQPGSGTIQTGPRPDAGKNILQTTVGGARVVNQVGSHSDHAQLRADILQPGV